MAEKQFSFLQKTVFSLTLLLFFFLLIAGVGEIVMRVQQKELPAPYNNKEKDKLLGWKSKAFYHCHKDAFADNKGGLYPLELNFTRHGFRKWNDSAYDSAAGSAFFIGDSYVESIECSDDKVFYSVFKDSIPLRVYACGTAGYGTTQELLLLRQYIDSVHPNWVVLETCPNDYIDNYWGMEMYSVYKVSQVRPYLMMDGSIEYRYPRPWYEHVKDYSLFLNFILEGARNGLIKINLLHPHPTSEEMVTAEGKNYLPFATTCRMTEKAFVELKNLCEAYHARLLVLMLNDPRSHKNEMNDVLGICARNNIPAITGAEEKIDSLEKTGIAAHSWDNYHFNAAGQKVLGQLLIDYFRTHELSTAQQ